MIEREAAKRPCRQAGRDNRSSILTSHVSLPDTVHLAVVGGWLRLLSSLRPRRGSSAAPDPAPRFRRHRPASEKYRRLADAGHRAVAKMSPGSSAPCARHIRSALGREDDVAGNTAAARPLTSSRMCRAAWSATKARGTRNGPHGANVSNDFDDSQWVGRIRPVLAKQKRAARHIVERHEARDVLHGASSSHALSRPADDDGKLRLPVALMRALGQHDVVVGARERAGRLEEQVRLAGFLVPA